jgi:uncharacterized repeat protein (TIGR03803 family)
MTPTARRKTSSLLSLLAAALFSSTMALAQLPTSAALSVPVPDNENGLQGGNPYANLIQASDGNLYGSNQCGGDTDNGLSQCEQSGFNATTGGAIVRITPAGVLTVVHSFTGPDGAVPSGMVEAPDGFIYGICTWGGSGTNGGYGTVFKLNIATDAITTLYSFTNGADGANPGNYIIYGTDGYLYGSTTQFYNTTGVNTGTVWKIKTDGTGFTTLHTFTNGNTAQGGNVYGGVTQVGTTLYGTAATGGANGFGTLFLVNPAATGTEPLFAVLHNFTNGSDGSYPNVSPRVGNDGFLYGTTSAGYNGSGTAGTTSGTIYQAGQSSGFTTIESFPYASSIYPDGAVTFDSNGNIYSTAFNGGVNGQGELFDLSYVDSTTTLNTLYSFQANDAIAGFPASAPFLDNEGRLWVETLFGGDPADLGGFGAFTTTPALAAPITITATPSTVAVNTNVSIAWAAHNVFSDNEKICFATSTPSASSWTGVQTGTFANKIYSGSKTITFSTGGTYVLSITCGGFESALVTVHVTGGGGGPVATTTTLVGNPNPVTIGTNLVLAATVKKSSGTGTPTGSVAFKFSTTTLATVNLNGSGVADYTIPTSGLPAGSYPLTAAYSGDTADSASSGGTTVVVKAATSATTLVITPNPQKIGSPVTFKATVTGAGPTPTGSVTFEIDGNALSTATLSGGVASATFPTTGLPAGTYSLTAVYGGDTAHAGSTSAPASVTLHN